MGQMSIPVNFAMTEFSEVRLTSILGSSAKDRSYAAGFLM